MPTGPKGRQKDKDDTKKETKKGNGSQRESLTKPNSVAAKSTGSTVTRKTDRRPDSIPTVRYPHQESPTISRHATNLTQVMEDNDSGIHETSEYKEVPLISFVFKTERTMYMKKMSLCSFRLSYEF